MKIPDEFCRFAIKWQDTYLGDPDKCWILVLRQMTKFPRTPLRVNRRVLPTRDEANRAKAEWAKEIAETQACDPHLKIVRIVPGPKRWLGIAAEMYVGVFETVGAMTFARQMTSAEARRKLVEAYSVMLSAVRAKNRKAVDAKVR